MSFSFPKVYPILDSSIIPSEGRVEFLSRLGGSLAEAGVTLLEYRNKTGADAELMADAKILRAALPAGQVRLILDDRADLVELLGFDGVHVDGGDALVSTGQIDVFGGVSWLISWPRKKLIKI